VRKIKFKLPFAISRKKVKITLPVVGLILALVYFFYSTAGVSAAALTGGSLTLSDSQPSASSVSYTIDFDNVTLSSIKCIKVVLSDAATGGSAPTGINTASVTYNAANSDYIPDVETWTAAELATGSFKITNATGETPGSATGATVQVTGITNGSTVDTAYYAQFSTYDNVDCSTSPVDSGVVTFIYTTGQAVSLTVDPSISFSISSVASAQTVNGATVTVTSSSSTIPLGTVTSSANAIAAHDLAVTTNAGSGYSVSTRYSDKPTSGSNDIDDHTGDHTTPTTMSAGTEAFGYTTEDTTYSQFQSNKYAAFTTSNAAIANNTVAVNNETTRVGYQVGVGGTTPAGTYTTTVILTCTPSY